MKKIIMSSLIGIFFFYSLFAAPSQAAAFSNVNEYIDNNLQETAQIEYNHLTHLPILNYRGGVGAVEGVVAHETANDNSTILGEIGWMSKNWQNAFVHAFVDDERIIEVHPTDYKAWGAGRYANERFIHVELVRTHSFEEFARSINNYAYYIARKLNAYDLKVINAETTGVGSLWSHYAVTRHLGGTTHVDPHGYFAKYGYNWNAFVELVNNKYHALQIDRISGKTRYATAVAVSQRGWHQSDTVILTRGDDYADALAGVPLAKKYDAPLLLTKSDQLTDVTQAEIKRLGAQTVYILGGEKAISSSVEATLKKMNINVQRLSGQSRTDTAIAIAEKLVAGAPVEKAVVVNGYNFPDALSVAAYAAAEGMPILLTEGKTISRATSALIDRLHVNQTYVIGGPLAVPKSIVESLPGAVRISGPTRYDTSIEVAEYFNLNTAQVYVTTGTQYPDAISGAALAAKEGSGVVLVGNHISESFKTHMRTHGITDPKIVGGKSSVGKQLEEELIDLVK
ncbi:cell wall-binding repeat-containing protein [Lentibacillus saliphilus]|uniref:cell wall-binding repeat-containing protein n=1 Tax=Lentibacillus saliphilus TaxID=2737028 RepID=UPI001FE54400|nr:cell wall-binding repeat-containing protein [Lentibacillus saliphilus]